MNLVFLGPPGAGKGTMASKLKERENIPHISTGDIFRTAIREETDFGCRIKAIIDDGDLVPDELTVALVKERLASDDVKKGFILDGFPRTLPQAEALQGLSVIHGVIDFEASDEILIRRLSGRRIAKQSGRIYHIKFNPPEEPGKCDISGEPLVQRPDDSEEAVKHRLVVYHKQTEPLITFYREKGMLYSVDANNKPDQVFADLVVLLKELAHSHTVLS